jgi:hypothetical protein
VPGRITDKVARSTLLDFYRTDLDDWLAIGVVRDVADNFLRLRPPRLNKCVDGLEVKVTQGEISRRRARSGRRHTQVRPGDLLEIDSHGDRRLALAQNTYSTLVAGIYSTKPGMLGVQSEKRRGKCN